MKSIVKNPELAASGAERMKWFRERMPIVTAYNERFKREQTFKGKVIATTMHIEPKSAYWVEGMLAGGAESSITPIGVAGFAALTALSTSKDPGRCSIPFDKERDGFLMGEGAGVLILEELEHAKHRGARILAEVVGYGATSDAYHITSPAEDGEGAAQAMRRAIQESGADLHEITYINAHGTSTHHNDLFETRAIKKVFGEHACKLKVNSTKSMVGHLLGAAGAVELIACVKTIPDSYIHPTAGYQVPDEELDLNYVPGNGIAGEVEYALSNSLGFGGHNASILIRKYRP